MVFYFSGTGNSYWIAKQIGKAFNEQPISIVSELNQLTDLYHQYSLKDDEKVFFVFPVHSWGPAVLVLQFIKKLQFENYIGQDVFSICVCGDNCGKTDVIMKESLARRNISLTQSFSIQMPNNYILMKGFGVDPPEIEEEKLAIAPILLGEILLNIKVKSKVRIYVAGKHSFVKSRIVYPLFKLYALGRNSFFATDCCTSCGLCVKICPTKTISMIEKKPVWSNNCVQCCACINRCPEEAIQYGNITQSQGRYKHPDL
jgi:Formate hydrogenlyase subunit 6/NADH:ubiquinone oxidoreductase 23 kD subunit (chain I)